VCPRVKEVGHVIRENRFDCACEGIFASPNANDKYVIWVHHRFRKLHRHGRKIYRIWCNGGVHYYTYQWFVTKGQGALHNDFLVFYNIQSFNRVVGFRHTSPSANFVIKFLDNPPIESTCFAIDPKSREMLISKLLAMRRIPSEGMCLCMAFLLHPLDIRTEHGVKCDKPPALPRRTIIVRESPKLL
jgi:hypothetical protein